MEQETGTFAVETGDSLRDALIKIDANGYGIVFVVDDGRVVGALSDGDIRRALLDGLTQHSRASAAMNPSVTLVTGNTGDSELRQMFKPGLAVVPRVDADGLLVDFLRHDQVRKIPIAEPEITDRERLLVDQCMASGWISSIGHFVPQFEDRFSEFLGAGICISVSNGTSGLALALSAMGIGPGDEVIVPDLTFAATANAVMQVGATPVIVDVDHLSMGLSVEAVNRGITPRTRAVMVVHLYGFPAELGGITELCQEHGIMVIEDCAEAIGTHVEGVHVGTTSEAAVFSFFANKTVTTGEGGMVVFRDPEVAEKARRIRNHGMSPGRRYWHESWGTNFRLTNIQAAIGVAQLERVASLIRRKQEVARVYEDVLSSAGIEGLELRSSPSWGIHSHWLYTVLLPDGINVAKAINGLDVAGIETRPVFYPLHVMPAFRGYVEEDATFPNATELHLRGLSLPSSVTLKSSDVEYVALELVRFLRREVGE